MDLSTKAATKKEKTAEFYVPLNKNVLKEIKAHEKSTAGILKPDTHKTVYISETKHTITLIFTKSSSTHPDRFFCLFFFLSFGLH